MWYVFLFSRYLNDRIREGYFIKKNNNKYIEIKLLKVKR